MEPEEFMVLTIEFENEPIVQKTTAVTHHYSRDFLQPIVANEDIAFRFDKLPEGNRRIFLRAGITRQDFLTFNFTASINGHEMIISQAFYRNGPPQPKWLDWGVFEVEAPLSFFQTGENVVRFRFTENGGHVTSCILRIETKTVIQGASLITMASLQPENQVRNPSFENGQDQWMLSGAAEIEDRDKFEGEHSLRLRWDDAEAKQRVTILPGVNYELVAFCRVFNAGYKMSVVVTEYDGPDLEQYCTDSEWTKAAIRFSSGRSTKATIKIVAPRGNAGYFDYLRLAVTNQEADDIPEEVLEDSLIKDRTFEIRSLAWRGYGSTRFVEDYGFESNHSGRFDGTSKYQGIEQVLELESLTDYVLSVKAKMDDAGELLFLGVKDYDGEEKRVKITSPQWSTYSLQFMSGSSTTAKIFVAGKIDNRGYVDNFDIIKVPPIDSISFLQPTLTSLPLTGTVDINVNYSCPDIRAIVVRVLDLSRNTGSQWVAGGRKKVQAGRGTTSISVSLNLPLVPGTNYRIALDIREITASLNEALMILDDFTVTAM
eukprot:Plantae.Rhodophyta-Purpureofilum_apyrenoidigerum.ctg12578.p1 GENE.Plantae.Rhodophyta-Purpureofilum_apyrenoidigerum.ctg12578~~Plantae.Rhodophyta-Purpureofilum_apyrenoidigerum.ctg12578.p1  ORF type:complete len:632 (-),score=119.68 Plantae.Rhodophyta-Purpureofilum_apyrenoidigerum.ctg12578:1276-2904(-)